MTDELCPAIEVHQVELQVRVRGLFLLLGPHHQRGEGGAVRDRSLNLPLYHYLGGCLRVDVLYLEDAKVLTIANYSLEM